MLLYVAQKDNGKMAQKMWPQWVVVVVGIDVVGGSDNNVG